MSTAAIASISQEHGSIVVTWETLGDDDEGAPYNPPVGYVLDSMQAFGTWDSATLTPQGSNQRTAANYGGLATGITADGYVFPGGPAYHYRPASSGGQGSTDLDVVAIFTPK